MSVIGRTARRFSRLLAPLTIIVCASTAALAAEPSGCDKFAWPVDHERQLLASPQATDPSTPLDRAAGTAVRVPLQPFGTAKLAMPPERKPKKPVSFAGMVSFKPASAAGTYHVTLSEGAWIDVVQDGHYVHPSAFTGATDCANARKSVAFKIGAGAFVLQLSDVAADSIAVVVTPAD